MKMDPGVAKTPSNLTQIRHRHRFLTENFITPLLLHPRCNGCGWLAGLKTAENGAVFFGALLKGKELHVLKPLNLSGFGFPSLKHPLFDFIVAHGGIETNFGVWSLARKLKILGRLRLFRLVVTGVGRLD
jgi:hypothetical protein